MTDIEIYWKSGQPLYRCLHKHEYEEWLNNNSIPAHISFSNDLEFAKNFNPWGAKGTWLIILKITPTGKIFDDAYKRILIENYKGNEPDEFLDLPYEVMFDIPFKLSEVKYKIIT